MAIRHSGIFSASIALTMLASGCIPAPGMPGNQNPLDQSAETDIDGRAGFDLQPPSNDASITEFKNAFVLSVPLVGDSLAGSAAGEFTTLAATLSSPGWGSGAIAFDVAGMDWLAPVRKVLGDAAGRGGLIRNAYLPLAAVGSGPVVGNLADLPPAPGMATVGVLPIVFITTDFEGFPAAGAALEVGLWSQQAPCSNCPYGQAIRFHQETTPLISSIEIRQLREAGLWNDRLIAVIAKTGIWWAQSENSKSPVRNWMILKPTGGEAGQVRCLTSNGEWPG